MTLANWQLESWTTGTIATECRTAYAAFAVDVRQRHIAYYDTRADQRSTNTQRPFEAADLRFAFPPGWEALAETPIAWRRHARSAASSQTLLLSLLAPAIDADPTLSWLKDLSGWLRAPGNVKSMEFEHTLDSTVLDERPRQTSLDWFLSGTETCSRPRRSSPRRDSSRARAHRRARAPT
jgi:hypothetical protein